MRSTVEKVVLICLGILIAGYLYYAYYLSDQLDAINSLRHDIASTKQTIHKLDNEKKTIDSKIDQELNKGSEVNNAIPDNFNKTEVIRYFYDLIKTYGLNTDKASFAESVGKDYKTGAITFKVSGTYDSVKSFINQVENDKRKFVVRQANMGFDGEGYSATMTVEFYALK